MHSVPPPGDAVKHSEPVVHQNGLQEIRWQELLDYLRSGLQEKLQDLQEQQKEQLRLLRLIHEEQQLQRESIYEIRTLSCCKIHSSVRGLSSDGHMPGVSIHAEPTINKRVSKESLRASLRHEHPAAALKVTERLRTKRTLQTRLQRLVESTAFELVSGSIIILNALFMAAHMQYSGLLTGYELNYPRVTELDASGSEIFDTLQLAFASIFIGELIIRLVAFRLNFFRVSWNVLDFCVVLYGVIDLIGLSNSQMDPGMVRLLRLVKLVRLLKMLNRAAYFLDNLNLIVKSIMASFTTLSWAMIILIGIQWISAMVLGQLAQNYLSDQAETAVTGGKDLRQVYEYYGTFSRTMITMFEVTHVNYGPATRVLMNSVGEHTAWLVIVYRCIVSFAVLNVIRAVFIQQTLKVAERDRDLLIRSKASADKQQRKELQHLFDEITGETDTLKLERWKEEAGKSSLKEWMLALDIGHGDVESVFNLMDSDGNGELTAEEFIKAATKLRGHARAIDLIHLLTMLQDMESKVDMLVHLLQVEGDIPDEWDRLQI
mmetsp:Transcript_77585/g.179896  ORF Transcript_77585/g.179896 Transcript_77585/m.179896 type:complete len:545 (-) Transcript_77585:202-1836(-)